MKKIMVVALALIMLFIGCQCALAEQWEESVLYLNQIEMKYGPYTAWPIAYKRHVIWELSWLFEVMPETPDLLMLLSEDGVLDDANATADGIMTDFLGCTAEEISLMKLSEVFFGDYANWTAEQKQLFAQLDQRTEAYGMTHPFESTRGDTPLDRAIKAFFTDEKGETDYIYYMSLEKRAEFTERIAPMILEAYSQGSDIVYPDELYMASRRYGLPRATDIERQQALEIALNAIMAARHVNEAQFNLNDMFGLTTYFDETDADCRVWRFHFNDLADQDPNVYCYTVEVNAQSGKVTCLEACTPTKNEDFIDSARRRF